MGHEQGRRRARWAIGAIAVVLAMALTGIAQADPPQAGFDVSPATARVGATVSFTAHATAQGDATIASYAWDFGDGSTGSGDSASHAYDSTGAKTVTLTVTDSNGEQATASHGVQVVGLPQAAFSWAPQVPNIGQSVAFDGRASSDPGGAIRSYAWDFGDGTSGDGATPTHAYGASGDKTVKLTITADLDGRTAQSTQTLHVNVPPQATFVFAAVNAPAGQDPFTPVLGQQVAFSAQGSTDPDGSIATYQWDLGDGTFGDPATVSWLITSFPADGTRTIRLRVTDNHGATADFSRPLRVNTPPVAAFDSAPASPHTGDKVTFTSTASDADGSGDLATIAWDLNGDGTFDDATGPTAQAVFLTAGDYTVAQRVTDKGGATNTTFRTITVAGQPAPPPKDDPSAGDSSTGSGTTVVPSPGAPPVSPGSGGGTSGGTSGGGSSGGTTGSSNSTHASSRVLVGVHVRFAGSVTDDLTTISSLAVVAPKGAIIGVRCFGRDKGCPEAFRLLVTKAGRIRLSQLQRTYKAGARIRITVRKKGFLHKRIVIRVLRGRAPQRLERCVIPATTKNGHTTKRKVTACPRS
ncbi:MAG TPA: PKD domain-containing protein [Baekduia sp.]|nr:PKD domain-containing protein [Baekduia sp.]